MLEELHSNGKTVEDIVQCLKQVPVHPRIVAAIRSVHALGYCTSALFLMSNYIDNATSLSLVRN